MEVHTEKYPIKFVPISKEVIWGVENIKKDLNIQVDGSAHKKIGEIWLLSDNKRQSIIANGSYKGMKLGAFYQKYKEEIFMDATTQDFPLLIKYIVTDDRLSVQVHPDDAYAMIHEKSIGKTEAWYVLENKEGKELILSFNEKVTEENYCSLLKNETADLEKYLNQVKVEKGDLVQIEPGMVHALPRGMKILEVQQNSDVTYRIYDYNRPDLDGRMRALHLDKALDVIDLKKKVVVKKKKLKTHYFSIEEIKTDALCKMEDEYIYIPLERDMGILYDRKEENVQRMELVFIPRGLCAMWMNTGKLLKIGFGKRKE